MPSIVAPTRPSTRRPPAVTAEARSPRPGAPAEWAAARPGASRQPAGGQRVLVVDDEATIRTLCRINLALEGFEVAEAENGGQALELLASGGVDLVLLDVMLPDIGGFDVARRIVAEHPTVPIVFLSARADPADLRAGYEAGGVAYVTKPFDPTTLAAQVGEVLERASRGEAELYRRARLAELEEW